jgi:hypothetical protein
MALMETMYGFSIMFVTLAHVFLETYEYTLLVRTGHCTQGLLQSWRCWKIEEELK